MNVAIANAMLREQIQRSRPFLILSLVICVLFVLIQRTTEFADEVGFQRLGIFFVHAVGFVSMLYCHSDDRNVSVLMPGYLLQLPVRTIDLVFCRFGYGLFCAAIITVGCSIVHFAILEPTELSFAFWTPFKVGIVTFALLQALAWTLGSIGLARLVVLLVFVQLVLFLTGGGVGTASDIQKGMTQPIAIGLIVAVSFVIAYVGVTIRRKDGFGSYTATEYRPTAFSRRRVDLPPFKSPDAAMYWFEWRRQSRLLPLLVCCLSTLIVITTLSVTDLREQGSSNLLVDYGALAFVVSFFVLGITAATFGAFCCFQNQSLQLGSQRSFLFLRPVSTKSLARARLRAVMRSVLISIVPVFLCCAFVVVQTVQDGIPDQRSGFPSFVSNHLNISGAGIAFLLFCGVFAIAWSFQWFGNLFAPLLLFGAFALFQLSSSGKGFGHVDQDLMFYTTGLLLFIATVVGAYIGYRQGVLDKRNLSIALVAWPLLAVGFALWVHLEEIVLDAEISWTYLLHNSSGICAFAILPLAPFVTVPLFMQWARHR